MVGGGGRRNPLSSMLGPPWLTLEPLVALEIVRGACGGGEAAEEVVVGGGGRRNPFSSVPRPPWLTPERLVALEIVRRWQLFFPSCCFIPNFSHALFPSGVHYLSVSMYVYPSDLVFHTVITSLNVEYFS